MTRFLDVLILDLERIADDLDQGFHRTTRVRVGELTAKVLHEAGEVDVTPALSPTGEIVSAEVLGLQYLQRVLGPKEAA